MQPSQMRDEMIAVLPSTLGRLWRFAQVLTNNERKSEVLVQQACLDGLNAGSAAPDQIKPDVLLFKLLLQKWQVTEDMSDSTTTAATDILRAMHRLPSDQRIAILIVYGERMSYQDAAKITGKSVAQLMEALAAGRKTLAQFQNGTSHGENATPEVVAP